MNRLLKLENLLLDVIGQQEGKMEKRDETLNWERIHMASSARLDLHAVELAIMALFVIMAAACYRASYRLISCFVLCHENFLLDLFALRIYSLCSQIQNFL